MPANGVKVAYLVPKEGAVLWVDVMAIPKDAPNPAQGLAFIEYLLDPKVIANASNFRQLRQSEPGGDGVSGRGRAPGPRHLPLQGDPAPSFITLKEPSDKEMRELNRIWTRLKANR
jgi:putrescine transport system substrate-binding protein